MDPITIAMGLASIAPKIVGWIAGDKAEDTANKVLDVAKSVTGLADPAGAVGAIKADPTIALEFQKQLVGLELALAQEDNKAMAEVNATMRAESQSERWPQWSWRPFCGFCLGLGFLVVTVFISILAFDAVKTKDATALNMVPQLVGSFAALFACIAPVVGVAAWKRGQAQVEKVRAGASQ